MEKIAILNRNWVKDASQPVKSLNVDGELQKRFEEFSKMHKIINVQPFADKLILIRYEE